MGIPHLSSQDWSTVFSGIQTLVVFIGIVLALRNLKIISKTHALGAIENFTKDVEQYEEDRKFLYQKFDFKDTLTIEDKEEQKITNVINSINRISMLIDNKLISAEIVFALCHTMIIRCEYKLLPYLQHKEKLIGGRYGRRIIKLAKRAKQYHDSYVHHRVNPINLHNGITHYEIYRTNFQTGFLTCKAQRMEWWLRRMFCWF